MAVNRAAHTRRVRSEARAHGMYKHRSVCRNMQKKGYSSVVRKLLRHLASMRRTRKLVVRETNAEDTVVLDVDASESAHDTLSSDVEMPDAPDPEGVPEIRLQIVARDGGGEDWRAGIVLIAGSPQTVEVVDVRASAVQANLDASNATHTLINKPSAYLECCSVGLVVDLVVVAGTVQWQASLSGKFCDRHLICTT
jgi:hypothetical protein